MILPSTDYRKTQIVTPPDLHKGLDRVLHGLAGLHFVDRADRDHVGHGPHDDVADHVGVVGAGPGAASAEAERRRFAPYGLEGGQPGAVGKNTLVRDGIEQSLAGKATFQVQPGDRLVVETPGGGGWGTPEQ